MEGLFYLSYMLGILKNTSGTSYEYFLHFCIICMEITNFHIIFFVTGLKSVRMNANTYKLLMDFKESQSIK
jgi:hypothetical protein